MNNKPDTKALVAADIAAQALRDIANPLDAMERDVPEGHKLDGLAAVRLSENTSWYIEKAKKALAAMAAVDATPWVSVIRCPEKLKPGGCQLHNLQCGWPDCNKTPQAASSPALTAAADALEQAERKPMSVHLVQLEYVYHPPGSSRPILAYLMLPDTPIFASWEDASKYIKDNNLSRVDIPRSYRSTREPILTDPLFDAAKALLELHDDEVCNCAIEDFWKVVAACDALRAALAAKELLPVVPAGVLGDVQREKLSLLLERIRPKFGAPGSRDVDVAQQQGDIDAALCILRATPPAPVERELSEYRALLKNPEAIACLISQHENWDTEGQAITGDWSPHHDGRIRDLLHLGRKIISEDPECFEPRVRESFKLRHGESPDGMPEWLLAPSAVMGAVEGAVGANTCDVDSASARRLDGFPASHTERHLRRLLCLRVGGPGVYMDDGEASDCTEWPYIDFMRDSVGAIEAKIRERGAARYEHELAASKVDQTAGAQKQNENASAPVSPAPSALSFQARVQPWLLQCFGQEIAKDPVERNHRFLEESLELVQSCGCTQSEAHQLVDYTFGRPVGEPNQEAGGVMVTLAALCLAHGLDMHQAGETELARIWNKVESIRAKQAAKPAHSPLPGYAAQPSPAVLLSKPTLTIICKLMAAAMGDCVTSTDYVTAWNEVQSMLASAPQPQAPGLLPEPAADEWIPWAGGECPVADMVVVNARFADGQEVCAVAALFNWKNVRSYKLAQAEQQEGCHD